MFPIEAARFVEDSLGAAPRRIRRIGGGRNSRVYRLDLADGRSCALKCYHKSAADGRDRLGRECAALAFLRGQGVACVPAPLAMSRELGLGLYSFAPGRRLSAGAADADLDQLAGFAKRLAVLSGTTPEAAFGPASEACFCLDDVAASLEGRIKRLLDAAPASPAHGAMREFVTRKLAPASAAALARAAASPAASARPDRGERFLSPSDFGLHNAVRAQDGTVVFVDFEYFGWDDPAKFLCDFLLHPGMRLAPARRAMVARAILEALPEGGTAARIEACLPLHGFKWCLILLNEFLTPELSRRVFSRGAADPDLPARQLEKSKRMLARVLAGREAALLLGGPGKRAATTTERR
jgi:hypothetical protein